MLRAHCTTLLSLTIRTLLIAVGLTFALPALPAAAEQEAHFNDLRSIPTSNSDWMKWLSDSKSLALLSIPGTHDTMANDATYPVSSVLTQGLELRAQLDAGIRALDIRARHIGDRFTIHHGEVYLLANFDDVLGDAVQFLKDHPTETIFMRVKREHTEESVTRSFIDTFEWYRAQPAYAPFISCSTIIPSLGQARGKIVILNDFGGTCGVPWGTLNIQDAYEETDTDDKWDLVRNHFETADSGNAATLYANFLTASGGFSLSCFCIKSPDYIARRVNRSALDYLNGGNVRRAGLVMMDFPGAGLINAVIAQNFQEGVFSVPTVSGRRTMGAILEPGYNRQGMDYKRIYLPEPRPELCRDACFNESLTCKTFTYVQPGVGGSQLAQCYLKNGIPAPVVDALCTSGIPIPLDSSSPQTVGTTLELGVSRPGMDYTYFALPEARPALCRNACFNDQPRCQSFTYVKPGIGGSPRAWCWLKNGIPEAVFDPNTDSGTALTDPDMGFFSGLVEVNVDRPGMDYKAFELPEPLPELCRAACSSESTICKSFTYVRPGVGHPRPICNLKNGIPAPVSNPRCDSGVMTLPMSSGPQVVGTTLELGIDRPGMDYTNFEPSEARPALCRDACLRDQPRCQSFTYVKPAVGGSGRARCWLKYGIPTPVSNPDTDSGTAQTNLNVGFYSGLVEINVDRPGMDYRSFELSEARPELCRDQCRFESYLCKSFTYVRPGVGQPKPLCNLKFGIPTSVADPRCDSGINSQ